MDNFILIVGELEISEKDCYLLSQLQKRGLVKDFCPGKDSFSVSERVWYTYTPGNDLFPGWFWFSDIDNQMNAAL